MGEPAVGNGRPSGVYMPTVLVVDDDGSVRAFVAEAARDLGCPVLEASDGLEAWMLFQGERPEIVVSDIRMPGLTGVELLREIRRVSSDTEVLLMTAFSERQTVVEALRSRATDYVEKPVDLETLRRHLQPAIERCLLRHETAVLQEEAARLREREARESRLATLGRLLAGLAHELRNPLTFVKGNVEVLERCVARTGDADPQGPAVLPGLTRADLEALVRDLAQGVHRVEDLVKGLQGFAKPRRNEAEPLDLGEVLEASARLVRHRMPPHGVLRVEGPEVPVFVLGARADLETAFVNVLVNAAEAVGVTGGRVGVRVALGPYGTREYDGVAEVVVEDDGPGIPQGLLDEVFMPFFSRKEGGTGLGLSLAHEAVRRCGGQMEIESEEDRGTRVVIRLPYRASPGPEEGP
ncbi:hybrid sensor histidine kinase/response regulator [Deferrisoma sp.]